ncbi:hypothetical protein BDZ45DRAFT_98707 [Acephala macrosclerotiorum]|nr:hypothetical protein BDZ45DRAFT_98707 [Acephala macrosclerotiorum]
MPPLQGRNGNMGPRRVTPLIQEKVALFESGRPHQEAPQEPEDKEENYEDHYFEEHDTEEQGTREQETEEEEPPGSYEYADESVDPPSSAPPRYPTHHESPANFRYAVRGFDGQITYLSEDLSFDTAVYLDQLSPRVPVTPSMLASYSIMRGSAGLASDPLHHALFPVPKRSWGVSRVKIPMFREKQSFERLWRGSIFFWDEAVERPEVPEPPSSAVPRGPNMRNDQGQLLTYREYLVQFLATRGKGHYKGDKVYYNFGYVRDEHTGELIDPDTTNGMRPDESLFHLHDIDEHMGRFLPEPDFQRSEKLGPRLMTDEETEAFYEDFARFCEDHVDVEGDPRAFRITPTIFFQWATGARKGDSYEEERVYPENIIWKKLPKREEQTREPKKRQWEFCLEDGTNQWEEPGEEGYPTFLTEPAGINMASIPPDFHKFLPQVHRDLERQAFGTARSNHMAHSTKSPTPSDSGIITDDKVIRSLGETELQKIHKSASERLQKVEYILNEWDSMQAKVGESQIEQTDLAREVFFMNIRQEREQLQDFRSFHQGMTQKTPFGNNSGSVRPYFEGRDTSLILDEAGRAAKAASNYLMGSHPGDVHAAIGDAPGYEIQSILRQGRHLRRTRHFATHHLRDKYYDDSTSDDAGAHDSSCQNTDHGDEFSRGTGIALECFRRDDDESLYSGRRGHSFTDGSRPGSSYFNNSKGISGGPIHEAERSTPSGPNVDTAFNERPRAEKIRRVRVNEGSFASRAKSSGFNFEDDTFCAQPRADGFNYDDYYAEDPWFIDSPTAEERASWDLNPDLGDPATGYDTPTPLAPFPPKKEEIEKEEKKPRSKFQQHFDEAHEADMIKLNRAIFYNEHAKKEYEEIQQSIAELRARKEELLKYFSVTHYSQIPDFYIPIPQPREMFAFEKARMEQERREAEMREREEEMKHRAI